jgi:hypothetical protein
MRPVHFMRWFPVYWLLTVAGWFVTLISFSLGAVAGAMFFQLFFRFPTHSVPLAVTFSILVFGGGFLTNSILSKKWQSAIRPVLERMSRDIHG